ncbi:hypothetical protein [Endozoicomonas sp. SCSIO W0465]|uniref:hypothetical protein n=1 Tax=Endozoicomonas sp. SCSIO W0465 TaxID=2918516 RepID=UPI002075B38E|nr:hypothetical protein [Endozoicomonas sp. SCSIO W0465]USE34578.1 hypothetical protein MJO57_20880 [Endozoicomonas sp. SCSIO W0465]
MPEITVGELIKQLQLFNPKDPICFGEDGYFTFYRTKDRGGVVQIEFRETRDVDFQLIDPPPERLKK